MIRTGRQVFYAAIAALCCMTTFLHPSISVNAQQRDTAAAPVADFLSLKKRYLKLRNTDIRVEQTAQWEQLSAEFIDFAEQRPKSSEAAQALFNAAVLYEQLFRRYGGTERADQACAWLLAIPERYPKSEFADDALARCGDLMLYDARQIARARRAYEALMEQYPRSELATIAKHRLASIASGDYKNRGTTNEEQESDAADAVDARRSAERGAGKKTRKALVVVDPGHGGEDFGAVGVGGLLEKDVVLDVGLRLEKILKTLPGVLVRMTRRTDEFVPLAERTNLANDFEADLFVSLHVNASPAHALSGLEVYYLDTGGDKASLALAERENASLRFEGQPPNDLQFMLSDLIQNAKLEESILLAQSIRRAVHAHLKAKGMKIRDIGMRKAPFYVLVGAHMPCVLAELLFIDHHDDGALLAREEFRQELAHGLSRGIREFLKSA